jgi:hypothetical protein
MAETELVSMAQAFTGLPMDDLIGGPLMAAARANNAMAMTQVKFMLDTGFQQTVVTRDLPGGGTTETTVYDPIMIEMQLTQPFIEPGQKPILDDNGNPMLGPNGNPLMQPDPENTKITDVPITVNVPLITMMPINALAVDTVEITFDMEVKSSYAEENSKEVEKSLAAESSFEAKMGWGPFSVTVSGSVAYAENEKTSEKSSYEKSNTARYHVAVHAKQQDPAPGLAIILNALSKNIGPLTYDENGVIVGKDELAAVGEGPEGARLAGRNRGRARAIAGSARVGA